MAVTEIDTLEWLSFCKVYQSPHWGNSLWDPANTQDWKPGCANQNMNAAEANFRKSALSAAHGRALQWRKILILVDPKKLLWFQKMKKKVLSSALLPVMPLGPFDLLACELLVVLVGPLFIW